MSLFKNGNWGLKLLALALAIVIYLALKNESAQTPPSPPYDRTDSQSF